MKSMRLTTWSLALVALLGAALLSGCSQSNEQKLVGTWKLDTEKMLEESDMSDQEKAMARAMAGMMEMTMTFNSDGTMDMRVAAMGQEKNDSGTWKMLSEDGDMLKIITGKQEPNEDEVEITFLDDDTISFSPPDMKGPAVMIRQ